ncbi:hypothetical protein [Salipiger sp.]|uniref:hypothetical protein n=1 Tax=Salipiger sp. TaxID=2078585 RepID=UPI003A975D4E
MMRMFVHTTRYAGGAASGAALVAASLANPAVAQTTALDCVPPPVPSADLPQDVIEEYREELGLEFSDYFTEAQRYLQCLQMAEATARQDIDAALEAYARLQALHSDEKHIQE